MQRKESGSTTEAPLLTFMLQMRGGACQSNLILRVNSFSQWAQLHLYEFWEGESTNGLATCRGGAEIRADAQGPYDLEAGLKSECSSSCVDLYL